MTVATSVQTINFTLDGAQLGHINMPMPTEGDVVFLEGTRYRIARLLTHRITLLHPPGVTLLHVAEVER